MNRAYHKVIQVFEHEKLRVHEVRQGVHFGETHWQALLKLNENQYPPYFRVIHQGIQFTSFVGVIATPAFTIEILPKADAHTRSPGVWRNLLLDMLTACGEIPVHTLPAATLHTREGHILDIWLRHFLDLVSFLVQQGLAKQYQTEEGSTHALRGKLLFSQNISQNVVHQERFYTRHQTYDRSHLLHQMIRAGLEITEQLASEIPLQQKARQLKQHFPACNTREMGLRAGKHIIFNRQSLRYQPAVDMARHLLAHMTPVLTAGDQPAIALLFDMNRLFEEYVYRQLKKAAQQKNLALHRQVSTRFWARRSLRPDMVLQTPAGNQIILDTKWKILQHNQPADEDLKQIYIYNHYFQAQRGVLLYPQATNQSARKEAYHQPSEGKLFCEVQFVNILDREKQRLNPLAGEELLTALGIV